MEPENEKGIETNENLQIPRIDSDNPEERKGARSLRITRRQENLKKQEARLEETKFDSLEDESISIVEKQAAECAALLEHLLADGEEIVNNIRVASDAREVTKRFSEAEKKEELLNKLEEDANLAQKKFDEISSQWNMILKLKDPLEIDDEIKLQKQRCDDLIAQKNELILDLKKESQRADETFYQDLQKQLNDVNTLGERVDAQVSLMKNAYQSQISLIEQSIEMEQTTTIKLNDERWNALYNQRDREELQYTKEKLTQIDEFKDKIDKMLSEHGEKYRLTKMKLENEIQTLQNEFQHLKANCLINSEKIDYNYQILKRREEENILIRSQQQRRLNKMQDNINELKTKIKMITKNGTAEDLKSHKEIQRLQSSLFHLQAKANHFANSNEKKYLQVWKMNQKKADELIRNINELDKIIHEDVLELEWTPPNISLLKLTDLPSYKNAIYSDDLTDGKSSDLKNDPDSQSYSDQLAKKILDMVTDSSEFLIEERLWPLFEKHENLSTELCKLDNIFNALKITDDKDINLLCKYFTKYAFCENCNRKVDEVEENLETLLLDDNGLTEENKSSKDQLKCKCGSSLNIAPSDALSAIRDFVAYAKTKEEQKIKSPDGSCSNLISRCLTERDVEMFWGKYENAFTPQKLKLWDNITIALNKYLPILKDREKLNKDVTLLRKQNSELKNLLRGHNMAEPSKQKYLAPLQKDFKMN